MRSNYSYSAHSARSIKEYAENQLHQPLVGHYWSKRKVLGILTIFIFIFSFQSDVYGAGSVYSNESVKYSNENIQLKILELTTEELGKVVQAIIEMPDLNLYYPNNDNGDNIINIMQFPIEFPAEMSVASPDCEINFIPKALQSEVDVSAYFNFRRIQSSSNHVSVNFNYFYELNGDSIKMLSGMVELDQSGSEWIISNHTLTGDVL